MKTFNKKNNKGFTLIETIVAIFILTMTVGALLTLTAGGFYSVRYARNQIVADYLTQESLEYLHNTRDTFFMEGKSWDDWIASLNVNYGGQPVPGSADQGCFADEGCTVDPYTLDPKVVECKDQCANLIFFPKSGFYGYEVSYPGIIETGDGYETSFNRTIRAVQASDPNQVTITVTVTWLNGTNSKSVSQSTLITNWQP